MRKPTFDNRVTRSLGVCIPIANAPMGRVVTPDLVAAVANAGGIALVPGSLRSDAARDFLRATQALTKAPLGLNVPVNFTDPGLVDMAIAEGIDFATISTGPVGPQAAQLREAGVVVYQVVTSLAEARTAAAAGIDGLVVEGSEGAGLRGVGEVALMVLLPLIASEIDLPLIAAGGIADGASMAAAFALGAEGVQMGTRILASTESAVHDNFKRAIVTAAETDTIIINRHHQRPLRVLRTATTEPYMLPDSGEASRELIPGVARLYQEGEITSGFASVGQVGGRLKGIMPVAEIIDRTVSEFGEVVARLQMRHLPE